jgi:hypothetical protein
VKQPIRTTDLGQIQGRQRPPDRLIALLEPQ